MSRTQAGRFLDWPFWLWMLVGVGFSFAISAIGIFIVPVSALVALFLLRKRGVRRSAYGALVGMGALPLFVAWHNRRGPGTVCHPFDHGRGMQCDELYDPRVWLVVGIVLVVGGLAAHLATSSRRRQILD
jgi:hypothetical protein